ncbi:MAG: phospho-N-acetylmuramoyl-pentapeptide-transferase [Christensenellaceae bacterium]|nr:phospho-N-acetylmuramoyl-pentapeptide-transferase [Christensenellaceae bacterium]
MLRMSLSLVASFLLVFIIGKHLIKFFKAKGLVQYIYELGPDHESKQGTPSMGGFMFIIVSVLISFLLHKGTYNLNFDFTIILTLFCLLCSAIGFVDDYTKAKQKRNLGLTAKQKLIGQSLIAVLFSIYCYFQPNIGSKILIPFTAIFFDLGIFYIPIMSFVIIFIVNSANIQDGMDGLLSSVSVVGFISWAIVILSLLQMNALLNNYDLAMSYQNVAIFSIAIAGGCLGFLRYNYYPAKVFMGDTGSMFLGAASVGIAMIIKMPLLLLFVFVTPIISSLSVIIQRVYFKATKGKRIFKMSPIHHHFEKSGYSETQVIMMYAVFTTILSVLAIFSIYGFTTSIF